MCEVVERQFLGEGTTVQACVMHGFMVPCVGHFGMEQCVLRWRPHVCLCAPRAGVELGRVSLAARDSGFATNVFTLQTLRGAHNLHDDRSAQSSLSTQNNKPSSIVILYGSPPKLSWLRSVSVCRVHVR